jgi:hypothetical protein
MMSPKEALAKDGKVPVKMGQGRLSRAAIDRCKELAAAGWKIKGYEVSTSPSSTAPVVTKVKVSHGDTAIADLPPLRYDETMFKAVSQTPVFGRTVFSVREVCQFCNNSLAYHKCDTPIVLGVPVQIVAK